MGSAASPPRRPTWTGIPTMPSTGPSNTPRRVTAPNHQEHELVSTTEVPATTSRRRHAWLGVLLIGAALFFAGEQTLIATGNLNLAPTTILLGAITVPLAFLTFVHGRRLPYRAPGWAVAASAFLGGVIGTTVAATLEFDALRELGGLPMLGVGLIEESSKLLVPLALLVPLCNHRTRADGLLIGVACGAGFAALETMGYAFTKLIRSGGDITDTVEILVLRGFLSPAGHMAWTGIAAAALYAAAATWRRREVVQLVGALVGAVVLHALWDSQSSLTGTAIVAVTSLGLLGLTVHQAAHGPRGRREGRSRGQRRHGRSVPPG
jgi:protease PrsW